MKVLVFASLVLVAAASLAQDKVTVPRKPPAEGTDLAWTIELKFQVMNQDASFSGTAHRKSVKVNSDGTYEIESWIENGKIHVMGSDQDQPSEQKTSKFDAEGKPLEKADFNSGIDEVLSTFAGARVPKDGAKVGDKWKLTDPFDRIGEGEAQLKEPQEFLGKKRVTITVTYVPKAGGSCEGTVYWNSETGVLVGYEMTFKKLAIGPGVESDGTATMKLKED